MAMQPQHRADAEADANTTGVDWTDRAAVRQYKKDDRRRRRREGTNEPSDKERWKSVAKNGGETTDRISDEVAEAIRGAVERKEMSVNAAAKHFGVTYSTARRAALGLRKRGEEGTEKKTHSPRLTDDEREAIRSSYRDGSTIEQLAYDWRRGESTIRRVVADIVRK